MGSTAASLLHGRLMSALSNLMLLVLASSERAASAQGPTASINNNTALISLVSHVRPELLHTSTCPRVGTRGADVRTKGGRGELSVEAETASDLGLIIWTTSKDVPLSKEVIGRRSKLLDRPMNFKFYCMHFTVIRRFDTLNE